MALYFVDQRLSGALVFNQQIGPAGVAVGPGVGALTLAGFAPAVAQSVNRSAAPGVGALVFAGYAPTLAQTASQAVAPGVGALALAGYAPVVFRGDVQAAQPGAGALVLAGYAPVVQQFLNVAPGAGAVTLAGYAPTLAQTASQTVAPGIGALSVAGFAPVVLQAGPNVVAPGAGTITLAGHAPFIFQLPVVNDTGIVTWDTTQYAAFIGAFPEFVGASFPRTQALFSLAECTLLDNTTGSPVMDICYRTHLFYLLMGHLLLILGSNPTAPDNTPPGRLSSATEGTVSSGFEYLIPAGSMSAPWYLQTKYGALYWTATARFRSLRYVANGSSGIGFATAYGTSPVNRPGGV